MNDLPQIDPRRTPPPIPGHSTRSPDRPSSHGTSSPPKKAGEGSTQAKLRSLTKATSILIVIVCGGLIGAWFFHRPSAASLAQNTRNSVVVVNVTTTEGRALGSGFFVRNHELVTNYHVVRGATSISVELFDGRSISNVRLLRSDPAHDLALLQVEANEAPLQLREDDGIKQGEEVYALGNPEGFSFTFSSGVVSSRREFDGMHLLQITAPISHGSSGGPVIDDEGRVIGVSKALFSDGQNLNFAIEVRHVRDLLGGVPGQGVDSTAPIAIQSDVSPLMEKGVYAITYSADAPDSLALVVQRADDSLIALVGPADKRSVPTLAMKGPLGSSSPTAFDYGKPEVQFVVDSIGSRRLFVGHFSIFQNGSVRTIPFTAARRHRLLDDQAVMVIDGGDASGIRPNGATGYGVTVAGTIDWRDAGAGYIVGALSPYAEYSPTGHLFSSPGDSLSGFVTRGDSVVFRFRDLTCEVPTKTWPTARGACWSQTKWYGVTLADNASSSVSRAFWREIPAHFAGILGATRKNGGALQLEYLTDEGAAKGKAEGKSARQFAAWRSSLEGDEFASPVRESWPESAQYFDIERDPTGRVGSVVVGRRAMVLVENGALDTVSLPPELVTEAGDSAADLRALPLSSRSVLVELSIGKACSFFLLDNPSKLELSAMSPCRRLAAMYDVDHRTWRLGSTPAAYSYRYFGWKSIRLNDSTALLRIVKDDPNSSLPEQLFYAVDASGYRAVENPLPESADSRLNVRQFAIANGQVWVIAKYCRIGELKCFDRHDIASMLLKWTPGRPAEIVATDSTGAFSDAELLRSDADRVFMLSRDTIRITSDWSRRAPYSLGDDGVQIRVALDDTINNTLTLVSNLGEVARVSLPVARETHPTESWIQGLASWARRFGARGQRK